MAGCDVGFDAGQDFLAVGGLVHFRPGLQFAHVELRHRRLAPWLLDRPGQLLRADDDAGAAEQGEVDAMVVVRVGDQEIGHVGGFQAAILEPLHHERAHAEAAGVDHRDMAAAADQHHGAPAKPAVADGLAGVALDQNVDVVAVDVHDVFPVLHQSWISRTSFAFAPQAASRKPRSVPVET